MNNSQLLYKIAGLQHSIRLKEAEYRNAITTNDQLIIQSNIAALTALRQDLAVSVKEFNSIPPPRSVNNKFKSLKEIIRRLNFVNIKALVNKK